MTAAQVQQLIDLVKGASSVLWQAALHQVYASIITNFIEAGFVLILAIALAIASTKFWKAGSNVRARDKYADDVAWTLGSVMTGLGSIVAIIVAFVLAMQAVQMLLAPDYAAIQQLTNLIPGN